MSRIDLGLVDGNYWNAAHVDAVEAAINESSVAGEIKMYIGTSEPTGYLLMNGQVVPTAQTLYPDLWAVAPAGWKSGAALTLPNMASRVPFGQSGTVGSTGGANTKTIAEANLPVHHHAISGTSSIEDEDHTHQPANSGDQFVVQRVGGPNAFQITPGTGATISTYSATSGVQPALGVGLTGHHRHTYSGNTTDIGSGTALDVTPAYLAVNFIVRCF